MFFPLTAGLVGTEHEVAGLSRSRLIMWRSDHIWRESFSYVQFRGRQGIELLREVVFLLCGMGCCLFPDTKVLLCKREHFWDVFKRIPGQKEQFSLLAPSGLAKKAIHVLMFDAN